MLIVCLLWAIGLPIQAQAQNAKTDPLQQESSAQARDTWPADDSRVAQESAKSANLLKTSNHSQIDFLLTQIHLLGMQQEKQTIDSDTKTQQADNSKPSAADSNSGSLKPEPAKATLIQTTYSASADQLDDQPAQYPAAVRFTITAPHTIGTSRFAAARSRTASLFPVLAPERSVRARR